MKAYPFITEDGDYTITDYGNGHKTRILKSEPEPESELPEVAEITIPPTETELSIMSAIADLYELIEGGE